jgi:hypothetical protein
MVRVTYDYMAKDGFLETKSVVFKEMRTAFALIRNLSYHNTIIGKPILERV